MTNATILIGDVRQRITEIADNSIQCVVTSPPYWGLRDYGHDGQIGLEQTPDEYVAEMLAVFRDIRRILKDDGTLWLNIGDSYCTIPHGPKEKNAPQSFDSDAWKNRGQERSGSAKKQGGGHANRKPLPGLKHKDLVGIPWRVAFALQADGWWLRQDIIWHKPNPMPESVTDRCTKAHEYLFLLTKSPRYYFDNDAIREKGVMSAGDSAGSTQRDTRTTHGIGGGNAGINKAKEKLAKEIKELGHSTRNKRDVWTIPTRPFKGAHFAVMPEALVEPCILAGSRENDIIFDPFTGSGTVAAVALKHGRHFTGIELNPDYAAIAHDRITDAAGMFGTVTINGANQ